MVVVTIFLVRSGHDFLVWSRFSGLYMYLRTKKVALKTKEGRSGFARDHGYVEKLTNNYLYLAANSN